jgi:hypothetical protein
MLGLFLLTIRELRARKVIIGLAIVATLIWITMALALQLDVVDGTLAAASVFGQQESVEPEPILDRETGEPLLDEDGNVRMRDPRPGPFGDSVLESWVFGAQAFVAGAAYWIGIVLALFATGGLVALLSDRGTADLMLSKPLSRSSILLGRLSGIWVVTFALVAYLLGAVWLVMSLKSGIWNPRFLLAIPVVFGMFAVVYGVVTLVSVWSGSGPLALIVTLGLVFISLILAIPELDMQLTRMWRPVVNGAYHLLPKFGGVGARLVPALATGQPVLQPADDGTVIGLYPFVSSLIFGAVCYGGAFLLFKRKDF